VGVNQAVTSRPEPEKITNHPRLTDKNLPHSGSSQAKLHFIEEKIFDRVILNGAAFQAE
jgi:hypothetical protein